MLRASVLIGDSRLGVSIRPRSGTDLFQLAQALRGALGPEEPARVRSGSVSVGVRAASKLMDLREGFDLDWSPEARQFVRNRTAELVNDVERSHSLKALASDELVPLIQTCRIAHLLDNHQRRSVALMTIPGSFGACIFDEQGTGKTVSVIAAFDLLVEQNDADVLLVIAPKSMVGEWASEISNFTDGLYRVEVLQGTRSVKARQLTSGADVYVCNYETVVEYSAP